MSRALLALFAAGSAASIGCGNFTNFLTARSLEAGEGRVDSSMAVAGSSFAIDLRGRAGLGGGVEAGASIGYSGLLNADIKVQVLEHGDQPRPARRGGRHGEGNGPVNLAIAAGAGITAFADHAYGQVIASRRFEDRFEPYIAYRYQVIRLDIDLADPDDVEDTERTLFEDLVENAEGDRLGVHHVFFGLEIMLSPTLYVMPEVSYVFGDARGLGDAGIAFGVKW